MISRLTDRGVEVFDAYLDLAGAFEIPEPDAYAVAPSRDRLVYTTGEAAICVGADGRELWRFPIPAGDPADCAFSGDGVHAWLYIAPDQWLALDAGTGEVRARHILGTDGHGGQQIAFPDGEHMMLDTGSRTFHAGPSTELRTCPWDDRSAIAIAPDARLLMTVAHDQEDVSFHQVPDGEAKVTIRVADFAEVPASAGIEWTGGFLDEDTAIVVLSWEEGEEARWRHFRVDVHTGEVIGDLGIMTIDEYDLQPLGDGTYVITDTDGTLRRM
ncbi:hypothetical protein FB565_004960 [Actinoplanes lutulentus]|uniref:Pyrroloquinoline-quinone binding quinoprotein n=1 Tax=Actinoplanes lutulentus TaxID=1287878 RepID=A0A327ZMD6_9ACTN|nr:hypothetical protein [Actinoplanes lutulentus]MBB2945227.1 hypothetical protein [Actinoplanes lutulentus]RAK40637.1 hypothetical protein B0I29_103677 [Actinoplanes lutulentus]